MDRKQIGFRLDSYGSRKDGWQEVVNFQVPQKAENFLIC